LRPEILSITQELSHNFMKANQANFKAIRKVMTFSVNTKGHGFFVGPAGYWNGKVDDDYQFEVLGISDLDYAKGVVTRRSISGYAVFLNNMLIPAKSKMQECVTLSVAEAELMALISFVQEMVHVKQQIESMSLNVKFPMVIKVDNKGGKDLANNWSIGGRTWHARVRLNYLDELKEKDFFRSIGSDRKMM
jgi:hypothetical protein